eukprot:6456076-Amphidinium_carterae.1
MLLMDTEALAVLCAHIATANTVARHEGTKAFRVLSVSGRAGRGKNRKLLIQTCPKLTYILGQ